MRLLDRYLFRELLIPLSYCLGGFLIFWISFDLLSEIEDFQAKKLKGWDIASYYLVKTPEMLSAGFLLPIALLLALLYALTNHARHHELTAIRAAGVSLWRLSLPYLAVGVLFSGTLFAVNELWLAESIEEADRILYRYERPDDASKDWMPDLFFRNEADDRLWQAGAYNLKNNSLANVHIVWNLPDGSRRDFHADRATWTNGVWHFWVVTEWNYRSATDVLAPKMETNYIARPEFSETPNLIKSELKVNSLRGSRATKGAQLSIQEILDYLRLHPNPPPERAALLKTQFHGRIAAPWTCLVVVLIAIPFGAPSGRRNVFVGVAASIFICFAYFILLRLGLALGTTGRLPPALAAWLPNILFALTGILLTCRVR